MQESIVHTQEELGDWIMGILVRLLEDQNQKTYQYRKIDSTEEETA